MFTLSFLSLFLLIIFLNIIQKSSNELITWNKSKSSENVESQPFNKKVNQLNELFSDLKNYIKLFLIKTMAPIFLYLLIFFVLKTTYNRMLYLIISFI